MFACRKDCALPPTNPVTVEQDWEKFLGNYAVYDTLGNFMYQMSIVHFSEINDFGVEVDSILITNFADTLDLATKFKFKTDDRILDIGVHHPIIDYNGKSWHVSGLSDDSNTSVLENYIVNDTLVMYFKMTNIAYYINEAVPYYFCECKHVAVKQ